MNKQPKSNDDKLFVHYKHEHRFQSLKRDIHHVDEDVFQNTPAMQTKLIVGNRNRRDTQNELIRKRPKNTLLRNTMTQSKSTQNTSTSIFSLSTYICTDFLFIRTTKKEDQTSQSNSTKRFPDIFHVFNYRTPSQKYLVLTLFFLSISFSSTLLNRTLIETSQYCEQNFSDFSKYIH